MPKMKTKSGAKKRFKITASGLIKREKAFKSHILTKKSRKRKSRVPDSETEGGDDVSERKSRFTKRADSSLLIQFAHEVDKLRPFVQRMLLQRDGAELREGSTHRTLNLHTILKVASLRMTKDLFRQFRKACNESYEDPQGE